MARILGLDLGSYSVKAVVLDSAKRGEPSGTVFEVPRAQEGDRRETLKDALVGLRGKGLGHVDQVVVALPGPSLATHALTLPFTDTKKVEAALPFEVEEQLPFDLGEAVYDYQVAGVHEGKSDLVVGVVRREELDSLLALLAELGFDPRVVLHPAMAYQTLWMVDPQAWSGADKAPVAIVDIGHERTCVAIGTPGGPLEAARTFVGGGKEIARGTQPMLRELRATLRSYTARTHRHVSRIHLCGGAAQAEGLAEQLTTELAIPTALMAHSSVGATFAQAYALALRGQLPSSRAPRFNLRRGEYAFKGHYDYLRVRVARLSIYAAALILLFIVFGVARNSMLSGREEAVDAQLCRVTQSVLGHCEKNYDRALNMLRGKESPAAAVPRMSAVNLLSELLQRIPSDINVTFDQIMVDPERVTVRGQTDSSKQIDRISQALKAFRCFHEVQVGKLEKTKDEHVTFNLDISVECPDQAGSGPLG
jgi:general secretion pathway protein L